MNNGRILRRRLKLLCCHEDDYSPVGAVGGFKGISRGGRSWKNRVTFIANLSTFTFVQHGESIHVRYTGTSKVQVKVRETISDTDVVFRYLVRGRVIATLVAQKQIPAFYHHRTEEIGTRIQIVACKTRNLVISTIQHAIASDCSHVTEYGKRYGMFRFPRFPIS